MRQPKHAMNSVGDEVHRFALPKGATQTAIETRSGQGAGLQVSLSYLQTCFIHARLIFQFRLLSIATV